MPELEKLPVVRRIEATPVARALVITGKTLVYVGIVAGLFVFWYTSQPGTLSRGGITLSGLAVSAFIVLYHVAFGFICQGIGRGIQMLEEMRSEKGADSGSADHSDNR